MADRIRRSPRAQRARVTMEAYDELFSRVPWHPGHLADDAIRIRDEASYSVFMRLAGTGHDILEIGCGGGNRVRQLAACNRRCVGIDISAEVLARDRDLPTNVELYVADAVNLSLFADDSFDFVFSKQLVEHIYPDDIQAHFCEVQRVLRPCRRYAFETPSRITGPHDVSRYFDHEATCFHLREYGFATILPLLRQAGFRTVRSPLFRDRVPRLSSTLAALTVIPAAWKVPAETIARLLPRGEARCLLARLFRLNVFIIAAK